MVRVQITVNGRTRVLRGSLHEVAEALRAQSETGVPFTVESAPPKDVRRPARQRVAGRTPKTGAI